MNKIFLIKQPGGLGDILFTQKIFWHFHNAGYQVICPVLRGYECLNDIIPWFSFPSWEGFAVYPWDVDIRPEHIFDERLSSIYNRSEDIISENLIFINNYTRYIDRWGSYTALIKYQFLNIDHSDWVNYVQIKENKDRQIELAKQLNFDPNKNNVLVNQIYNHNPVRRMNILAATSYEFKGDENIIELKYVPGYNLFDWIYIFENVNAFIVLDSANTYILEWLYLHNRLKAEHYHLFHRDNMLHVLYDNFKLIPWVREIH